MGRQLSSHSLRCWDTRTAVQADEGGVTSESASWTPLDKLDRVERGVKEATSDLAAAAGGLPPGIKLQMRIAMEHCDLGAIPLLLDASLYVPMHVSFAPLKVALGASIACSCCPLES